MFLISMSYHCNFS